MQVAGLESKQKNINFPEHVAIIMDGNGRWARKEGVVRDLGHYAGADNALNIVLYCRKKGLKYLTLYAFSSENWSRPKEEVEALINMFYEYILKRSKTLISNQISFNLIGSSDKFPLKLQKAAQKLCDDTRGFNKLHLNLAISYGGRSEITRVVKEIVKKSLSGDIKENDINENLLANYLDTKSVPDPDLLIRTGGEMRLSNFLLWQLSYSELYFTDILWPSFTKDDLEDAFTVYSKRKRRFGNTINEYS